MQITFDGRSAVAEVSGRPRLGEPESPAEVDPPAHGSHALPHVREGAGTICGVLGVVSVWFPTLTGMAGRPREGLGSTGQLGSVDPPVHGANVSGARKRPPTEAAYLRAILRSASTMASLESAITRLVPSTSSLISILVSTERASHRFTNAGSRASNSDSGGEK
jgi:hypothetical protein